MLDNGAYFQPFDCASCFIVGIILHWQTNSMLKATCTMLENQVEQLEIINEDYEEKQLQCNITR